MAVVIICSATIVNMIFAGCAWVTGKLMDRNITSALDTKKIQISHMNLFMLRPEKLSKSTSITMKE